MREHFSSLAHNEFGILVMLFFSFVFLVVLVRVMTGTKQQEAYQELAQLPLDDGMNHE
jgi:hypothetical protein